MVTDEDKNHAIWQDYLNNVMKKRGAASRDLYKACEERNASGKKVKAADEEEKEKKT